MDQDEQNLLVILPMEIWQTVLNRIDNPNDMLSCAEATSIFNNLLEPRKNEYTFPQILQILDTQKNISGNDSKQILKCRLVCNLWQVAINDLLQNRPHHNRIKISTEQSTNEAFDIGQKIAFQLFQFKAHKLSKKVCSFDENNCPFPSRHVNINEAGICKRLGLEVANRLMLTYREMALKTLDKHGHHFWHATINLQEVCTPETILLLIRNYVVRMPNLKSLFIGFKQPSSPWPEKEIILGTFPSLKFLNLLTATNVPGPVIDFIIASNNIKFVEILNRQEFPKLLGIRGQLELSIELRTLEELNSFPDNWSPVGLKLCMMQIIAFPWAIFFEKITKYKESLLQLAMKFSEQNEGTYRSEFITCFKTPLNLPYLKKLDLAINAIPSYDFLLGLNSLEIFIIRIDLWKSKIVKKYSDNIFIQGSMWDTFPRLKLVEVDIKHNYTTNVLQKYKRGSADEILLPVVRSLTWIEFKAKFRLSLI